MDVALATLAAFAEHEDVAFLSQIGNDLGLGGHFTCLWVLFFDEAGDEGALGDFVVGVFAGFPRADVAFSRLSALSDETGFEEERLQAVGAGVHLEHDVPTTTAVPTIGAAFGTELAPMKMGTSIAAAASAGIHFDMVNKHALPLIGDGGGSKFLC